MSAALGFDLDPTTQDIFDLLRVQPGDAFSPDALAVQLVCTPAEVRERLGTLAQLGLVERAPTATGTEAYIVSPAAPEL